MNETDIKRESANAVCRNMAGMRECRDGRIVASRVEEMEEPK